MSGPSLLLFFNVLGGTGTLDPDIVATGLAHRGIARRPPVFPVAEHPGGGGTIAGGPSGRFNPNSRQARGVSGNRRRRTEDAMINTDLIADVADAQIADAGLAGPGGGQNEYDVGDSGTAVNVDFANGVHQKVSITDTATITFSGLPALAGWLSLRMIQPSTDADSYSFAESIGGYYRPEGAFSQPLPGSTAGDYEILRLYSDGTNLSGYSIKQFLG